jgi:hypothetical protein
MKKIKYSEQRLATIVRGKFRFILTVGDVAQASLLPASQAIEEIEKKGREIAIRLNRNVWIDWLTAPATINVEDVEEAGTLISRSAA